MMPSLACPGARFLLAHWRGELGLWPTLCFSLLALRAALYGLQSACLPLQSPLVSLAWVLASLAVLVWQLRGALRAVDRNMSYSGDMVAVYLCYSSMALVLAVSLVQAVDAVAASQPPSQPIPAAAQVEALLPVSEAATVVHVQGRLDFPLRQRLLDTLAHYPGIGEVALDSAGGQVFAARALALTLEAKGLDTRVDGVCYSACTLVFMAGIQRRLGDGAVLGFHRYALTETRPGQPLSIDRELRRDQAYFLSRGATEDFVAAMFQRGHSELWKPEAEELRAFGVVNSGQ